MNFYSKMARPHTKMIGSVIGSTLRHAKHQSWEVTPIASVQTPATSRTGSSGQSRNFGRLSGQMHITNKKKSRTKQVKGQLDAKSHQSMI